MNEDGNGAHAGGMHLGPANGTAAQGHGNGRRPRIGAIGAVAAGLGLLWLLAAGAMLFGGAEAAGVGDLVAAALPLAAIWLAVLCLRQMKALRTEAEALRAALARMQAQGGAARRDPGREAAQAPAGPPARGLAEPAASFASRREPARQPPPSPPPAPAAPVPATPRPADVAPPGGTESQARLALGPETGAEAAVSAADYVVALNFPDSPDDAEGFGALRRALADHGTARLIRAAQDVLTLLAQDGVYMDDLAPDRPRPELWRRFAEGQRGRAIGALGGVHDRIALEHVQMRMKQDQVFRDAGHHFLRQFDRSVCAFAAQADDAGLAALGETRTARAFMLIGRVAGTFD